MRSTLIRAVLAAASISGPALADEPGGATHATASVSGAAVYRDVCQACHMADGKGGAGAGVIPALAGNPRLAAGVYPVTLVVRGRGAMPGFTDLLSPAQIAAVVTYVRTDFGNHFEKPVSEAEVKAIEGAKTGP